MKKKERTNSNLNGILSSRKAEDWSCLNPRGSWRDKLVKVAVGWSELTGQASVGESDWLCFRLRRRLASWTCMLKHKLHFCQNRDLFTCFLSIYWICLTLRFDIMNTDWLGVFDQIRQGTRKSHSFSSSENVEHGASQTWMVTFYRL